jgi:spermidine synthase
MLATGFAGLGYQIVWTQQAALWLGHEAAAVLAVVAAFFAGLALGSWTWSSRLGRTLRPACWYAAGEAVIGLWSLVLAAALGPVSGWLLQVTGPQPSVGWQWTVAFGGTFLLLLPATMAMGITLPAMERALTARAGGGTRVAALYAANTFGAVLGVLATAFWLVPQLGLLRTAVVCAVVNILCAAWTGWAWRHPIEPAAVSIPAPASGVLTLLACTGLLGIGYEVLVVRVLSQLAENTVYTYALLLAVYLVGTALGAAWWQRRVLRMPFGTGPDAARDAASQRALWFTLLGGACLLGVLALWSGEHLKWQVQQVLGSGLGAALAAEAVLAVVAFLLPTFVMGVVFSQLASQALGAGQGLGRSLAVNTLGAALAPLLFGVVLVPLLGLKDVLLLVVAGYLALAIHQALSVRRDGPAASASGMTAACALGGAVVALVAWAPPLAFVQVPEGGRLLQYVEGARAAVSVVQDADGIQRLYIDNRQQEGSSDTWLADGRQALLPLLLHPSPRKALFLGLGTGITASTAAQDPDLQVDAVELLPEVVTAAGPFMRVFNGGEANPRLRVLVADARRYVRTASERYDLVVSDNFHPARSGSGSLYTVEHFRAVRTRLADGGLFCQWLPLHQMDLDTARSIVASFRAVFPGSWAVLSTLSLQTPVLGLVARADGGGFDATQLRQRMSSLQLQRSLADYGLPDELALMGSVVAGPAALARWAGQAPLNTDDRPVVSYRAPRITYAPDSLPADRLIALLQQLGGGLGEGPDKPPEEGPDEGLVKGADAAWRARLAAYVTARNRFIEVGRNVRASADAQQMLARVRDPLLAVLRISPDFRPAYDPLLRMALALGEADRGAARDLLLALQRVQPMRPEAERALKQLQP